MAKKTETPNLNSRQQEPEKNVADIPPVRSFRDMYDLITEAERKMHRALANKDDYRYLLRESMAATEDFLAQTSQDPHYARYTINPLTLNPYA